MKYVIIALGLVYSFGVAGCATPTMKVPADVLSMDAEQIVATERKRATGAFVDESFKLGTYAVKDVDRDWDSSSGMSIGGFSNSDSTSGYSFVFGTANGDLKGSCLIEGNEKGAKLLKGITMSKSVSKFGCSCEGASGKAESVLNAKNDGEYSGTLKTTTGEYSIKAIYESEGSFSNGNPTGYRVDGESVVAATDVMYPGKVWLGKSLSDADKDELSCLFAGLMLYTGKRD